MPSPSPTKSLKPTENSPPTSNALTIAFARERQREKDAHLPMRLPPRHPLSLFKPQPPALIQAPWTSVPSGQGCPMKSAKDAYNKTCVSTVEDKTMSPGFALTNLATPSAAMKPTLPLPLRSPLPLPLSPRPCLPIHVPLPPSLSPPHPLPPSRRKTSGPMC